MLSCPLCLLRYMRTQRVIGIGKLRPHEYILTPNKHRTIHGMVYNAMKLFMEVNPQLFDDCSHEYTEMQNTAEQRKANRENKWDRLTEQAKQMRARNGTMKAADSVPPLSSPRGSKNTPSKMPPEDMDPMTHDSQKRLDALKLQDESGRDYSRDYEAQSPV